MTEKIADLINRALAGEEMAYHKIMNLYKGRIFGYVYRIIRNYQDAEEITIETFVRCFKSIKSFDRSRPLSPWLFAIAHNLIIDFLRKRKQAYEYLDKDRPVKDDFVQHYEKNKELEKLEKALIKLPPIDREIVILFYKEEHSYQEVSEILGIPVSTIKTRLHRARLKLRDLLMVELR